jgi:hypothetical protein
MSTTPYVEATSNDPFVRELHRRAMRLLNDPSLDRRQREFHMRRLQSILLDHQAKQAAVAAKLAAKSAKREQVSRTNRNQGVADQSQVVARRKEFERMLGVAVEPVTPMEPAEPVAMAPVLVSFPDADCAANEIQLTGRSRQVLTLKRA